jgi:alkylhydroperoxidase family enzyme
LFTERERAALEYAERITDTSLQVDDACFDEVQKHFNEAEIVSLTSAIAMQNYHSKFNGALRVDANEVCPLPLDQLGPNWR